MFFTYYREHKNLAMNIFIDENIPFLKDAFHNVGNVTLYNGRTLSNDDLIAGSCEYLISRSTCKVNQTLIKNTKVKFVATATSGIDHIDTNYLQNNNISFASALGSNANSVAEYVIYCILNWSKLKGHLVEGKAIGVIGYGNIGKLVAKHASLLGLKVYVNDPPLKDADFEFPDYVEYKELVELPFLCDVITNHVPLTKVGKYATDNLLDEKFLLAMNLESLLIHASRGGVVDENILLDRLIAEEIYACVDVFIGEPDFNTELAERAMLCSPHVAGYSFDGKVKGSLMVAEAFEMHTSIKTDKTDMLRQLSFYTPLEEHHYKDGEYVLELLSKKRKFDIDTKNMLSIIPLPDDERRKAFDMLRKKYPVRRESL